MLFNLIEIKENSLIHRNVNEDTLQVIVERVEKGELNALLGKAMVDDLTQKKISNTLNSTESELLNEYLIHFFSACVENRALYYLLYELRNMTVGIAIDNQMRGLTRDELTAMRDEIMADIELFRQRTLDFIFKNISYFPLFSGDCKDDLNLKVPFKIL